jgi:hypothetical protein
MKPHEEILLIIGLAFLWFVAALFAVAALVPPWGLAAGLVAVVLLAIIYRIFDVIDKVSVGLLVTLVFIPLTCIAAGIVWWGMRLLGLLDLN